MFFLKLNLDLEFAQCDYLGLIKIFKTMFLRSDISKSILQLQEKILILKFNAIDPAGFYVGNVFICFGRY